jgi:hypothetical protein
MDPPFFDYPCRLHVEAKQPPLGGSNAYHRRHRVYSCCSDAPLWWVPRAYSPASDEIYYTRIIWRHMNHSVETGQVDIGK